MTLRNMIDNNTTSQESLLIIFIIYWSQYTVNFLIYVVSSKQYRKAYILFLKVAFYKIKSLCVKRPPDTLHGSLEAVIYVERSLLPKKMYQFYKFLEERDQYLHDPTAEEVEKKPNYLTADYNKVYSS